MHLDDRARAIDGGPGGRLLFNIATLMQDPPGATRTIDVTGEFADVPSEGYRRPVAGTVHLLRTTRGILLRTKLRVEPEYECSRCLKAVITPVDLEIEELFAFARDPVSLSAIDLDPDEFHLEDEQYLDASEAVRQYEVAARPIRFLCRPDCAGLCSRCGHDLNEGPCDCPADESNPAVPAEAGAAIEPAWSALSELAARIRTPEVSDGRPEA